MAGDLGDVARFGGGSEALSSGIGKKGVTKTQGGDSGSAVKEGDGMDVSKAQGGGSGAAARDGDERNVSKAQGGGSGAAARDGDVASVSLGSVEATTVARDS